MDIHFFYDESPGAIAVWQNCTAIPRTGDFVIPRNDFDRMEVVNVVWLNRQVVEIHLK